jgi:tRNA wybutosine-synthesizing protein 3
MSNPLPPSFLSKKTKILSQLSVPASQYDDLSPKGSIDEGIRELIDEINGLAGVVTTSSCAGRVAVFVEGRRSSPSEDKIVVGGDESVVEQDGDGDGEGEGEREGERVKVAGVGGKGGGGRWVFVSHDPVPVGADSELGFERLNEERGVEDGKRSFWAEQLGMVREIGAEEGRAEDITGETRWIHFKFEPMVCSHLLSLSFPSHTFPNFEILDIDAKRK